MSFLAGRVLPAAELTALIQTKVKSADEPIANNTMQDDNDLFLTVLSDSVYTFHLHVVYFSVAAANFKFDWTLPAGALLPSNTFISGGTNAAVQHGAYSGTLLTGVAGIGANAALDVWGLLTTVTAGTMRFRWAQDTTNATSTIVRAGSFLTLHRT